MNCASEKIPTMPVPPSPSRFSLSPKLTRLGSLHLNFSQVVKATGNFSPSSRIGEGCFGTVYRARLEDGQVVAIKRAKKVALVPLGAVEYTSYATSFAVCKEFHL